MKTSLWVLYCMCSGEASVLDVFTYQDQCEVELSLTRPPQGRCVYEDDWKGELNEKVVLELKAELWGKLHPKKWIIFLTTIDPPGSGPVTFQINKQEFKTY